MVLFKKDDITIYNNFYDTTTDTYKYQRTVVTGVNWQGKTYATVTGNGVLIANGNLIFMDKLSNYISPKKFAKLSPGERKNYFTLSHGDKIVKNVIDFEITGIKPFRIADLESEYDNVIDVKSVNILSDHIEIEGV